MNGWVNDKIVLAQPPLDPTISDDRVGCLVPPAGSNATVTYNQDCINKWVVENLVGLKPEDGSKTLVDGCTIGAVRTMAHRHRHLIADYGSYETVSYVLVPVSGGPVHYSFQDCIDIAIDRAMAAPAPPAKPCGSDSHSPDYRACIDRWVNDKVMAQLPPVPVDVADDRLGCYMAPWEWSASSGPMPTYKQDCINRWVVVNLVGLQPDGGLVGPTNVAEGCTFGAVQVMARRHRRLAAGKSMPDTSPKPTTGPVYGEYYSDWQFVLSSYDTHTLQECVDGVVERAMAAGSNPMSPAPTP
jgi:hypothetical protein